MSDTISKSELWCEQHDHFKRSCPWCEIKELQDNLNQAIEALEKIVELQKNHTYPTLTSLVAQNALQSIKGGETDVTQTSSRS